MHIYIQLTAEGYQRSFPAIWGWHWYRSYLRPMEQRPEPQIVTRDPSFCWGFGLCFYAGMWWGFVLLVLDAQRFITCLHPLHLQWTSLISENCTVCMCSYQAILVSVLVLRITGICAHTLTPLTPRHTLCYLHVFTRWCSKDQIMNSLQTTFVNSD